MDMLPHVSVLVAPSALENNLLVGSIVILKPLVPIPRPVPLYPAVKPRPELLVGCYTFMICIVQGGGPRLHVDEAMSRGILYRLGVDPSRVRTRRFIHRGGGV